MLGALLDDLFLGHRAPAGHPERPARAEAVRDALLAAGLGSRSDRVPPRPATDEELARVHGASYLDELTRTVPGKSGWIDPDTYFSPETWDAALGAAGGVAELATQIMAGQRQRGLAVVRPPGHHATRDRAMGFCLVNNVAVAAAAARAAGAARVAILDWDVHHGNGTQDIFWDDPAVMYLSVHQYPYYPGTGAPGEIGGERARGATVNVGLPAGCGDADYAAAMDQVLGPAMLRFAPDLVIVSAGFDAHEDDPLASMRVTQAGFASLARRVRAIADRVAGGRLLVAMEGGYDLGGLSTGMVEVFRAIADDVATPGPEASGAGAPAASAGARTAIAATAAALAAIGGAP
ncbi:MAG: histone deacetylase [Kofleriaceae bacterium]|nr:histone deacetylase [Kofleriaceae bacterium]MBP6840585.1 histone deacetylase [Kofleriaceae bacterium]